MATLGMNHAYDRNSSRLSRENTETTGKDEYYLYDELNRLMKMNRGDLSSGVITGAEAESHGPGSRLQRGLAAKSVLEAGGPPQEFARGPGWSAMAGASTVGGNLRAGQRGTRNNSAVVRCQTRLPRCKCIRRWI